MYYVGTYDIYLLVLSLLAFLTIHIEDCFDLTVQFIHLFLNCFFLVSTCVRKCMRVNFCVSMFDSNFSRAVLSAFAFSLTSLSVASCSVCSFCNVASDASATCSCWVSVSRAFYQLLPFLRAWCHFRTHQLCLA